MQTQSVLRVFKNGGYDYIYIYYRSNNQTIRINTKNRFQRAYMQRDLFFKNVKPEFETKNNLMRHLKERVDEYIAKKIKMGETPNQKECKLYLAGKYNFNALPIEDRFKSVTDHYEYFLEFKKQQLQNRQSVKDYKSLHNALIDYERQKQKKLYLREMDSLEFMYSFRDFLSDSRDRKDGYLTQGNMQDNTIHKRISSLKTFYKYLHYKGVYTFKTKVLGFNVKKLSNTIIALTKEEIAEIYHFPDYTPKDRYIIDVFVLNCFMGLRYGDLKTYKEGDFIKNPEGQLFYVKTNQKTKTHISVPIVGIAKEILEEYNYDLTIHTNQVMNRRLKEIFEKYDLLNNTVKKNRKQKNQIVVEELPKRYYVSMHTSRKTYITLAIAANIPINAVMEATGHTQISTLTKYIAKAQNYKDFEKMGTL